MTFDINRVKWTYGIMRAVGPMDYRLSDGPMTPEEIRAYLGEYEFLPPMLDGVVMAVSKDREHLPLNQHFGHAGVRGDVLLGKWSGDVWVGVLGVKLWP